MDGSERRRQSASASTCGRQPTAWFLAFALSYDEEVRYSAKREMGWVGYKTHLSETSAADQIHLITHVTTTLAIESDMNAVEKVHHSLNQKNLLPDEHLLDGTAQVSATPALPKEHRDDVAGGARENKSTSHGPGHCTGATLFLFLR